MQGQTRETAPEMNLEQVQERAIEGFQEARGRIEEFARANPRTAVGIALGIGFVLGGGLTPRILLGVGAFVARRFARDYARQQLGNITRSAFGDGREAAAEA
jgi:hypothetical protein